MCSRVTLPRAWKASRRSGVNAAASARRLVTPTTPAIPTSCSKSRRVTSMLALRLRSYAGDIHWLALGKRSEVELQLRVLDRVSREIVHADRQHAPLYPLAYVPDHADACRPPGKVVGQAVFHIAQQPTAQELRGSLPRHIGVAIGAGMIPHPHPFIEARLAALQRRLRLGARQIQS